MCRYTTLWKRSKLLLSVCCSRERHSARLSWFWWNSVGVSKLGIFIDPGANVNGAYYCWHVNRVLHLSTGHRSCTPGTRHCATSRASNTCFHSSGSVATKQSRPQSSWLQDMECRPAASVPVMGAQCWRTQAAFGARLARHRPDHHWQCNWRVAWPSSCLCAGEGWTLNKCCDNIKRLIIQPCDNKRFICISIIRFT